MRKIKIKNLIKDIETKIEDKTLEIFKSALSSNNIKLNEILNNYDDLENFILYYKLKFLEQINVYEIDEKLSKEIEKTYCDEECCLYDILNELYYQRLLFCMKKEEIK